MKSIFLLLAIGLLFPLSLAYAQSETESVYPLPFGYKGEDFKDEDFKDIEPIYRVNPNNPEELVLDLDAMIEKYDLESKEKLYLQVDESHFELKSLMRGETIPFQGTLITIIIESLGASLIVIFIVLYAIKKRKIKNKSE